MTGAAQAAMMKIESDEPQLLKHEERRMPLIDRSARMINSPEIEMCEKIFTHPTTCNITERKKEMKSTKHLWMKKSLSLLMVILFAFSVVSPVFAQSGTDGTVTGSFTTAAAPSAGSVGVYQYPGCDNPALTLTPQQTYCMRVSVTDADSMADLDNIVVKLWWSGVDLADEASFDALTPSLDAGQAFTWTAGGGITPATNGTWAGGALVSSPNGSETSFDFVFPVTIGKIARETTAADRWEVAAKVTDQSGFSGFAYYDDPSGNVGLPMNWYGEIEIGEGAEVDWGQVDAGMAFTDTAAKQHPDQPITYIANGGYQEQVKSTTSWSTGTYSVALTDPAGGLSADQFALRATTIDEASANAETNSYLVPANGSTVNLKLGLASVTETGVVESDNTLFLSLGALTHPGTYTGTITYSIAND